MAMLNLVTPLPGPLPQGENSPKIISRFEPLNRSAGSGGILAAKFLGGWEAALPAVQGKIRWNHRI